MKITLNSKYEIHRKIGLMYRGCETNSGGTFLSYVYGSFILFSKQFGLFTSPSITIDLDTAEPDLRLAISEAMEFESGGRSVGSITHYFTQVNYEDSLCLSNFRGVFGVTDIQLSREWLESQNVEVSE